MELLVTVLPPIFLFVWAEMLRHRQAEEEMKCGSVSAA
jgi:hypothetical protein